MQMKMMAQNKRKKWKSRLGCLSFLPLQYAYCTGVQYYYHHYYCCFFCERLLLFLFIIVIVCAIDLHNVWCRFRLYTMAPIWRHRHTHMYTQTRTGWRCLSQRHRRWRQPNNNCRWWGFKWIITVWSQTLGSNERVLILFVSMCVCAYCFSCLSFFFLQPHG